ncbi:MAG: DNA polymerase I [Clostridia bacterium]|nr:DNA polymerase I [Clostridia bacterium]
MNFLVLDGNSILNRSYYGIRVLSNKHGQTTNAIYGFLITMQKLLSEVRPDAVAVAFDLPVPTFRHKMYSDYKSNRKKMPEELAQQIPILKELLTAMGYKLVSKEGYEADDILGTFAFYCEKNGHKCIIATGDTDSLQLVSENVTVRIAKTKMGKPEAVIYDINRVKNEFDILPKKFVDIKALKGDKSDNIPGIPGIGEKTAHLIISKYGTLEGLYEILENCNNLKNIDLKEKTVSKLIQNKELAFLSRKLGEICRDVPIDTNIDNYIPKAMNVRKVKRIMTDLEFFSLMEKMNLKDENEEILSIKVKCVNNFPEIINKIKKSKRVVFLPKVNENFEPEALAFVVDKDIYFADCKKEGFSEFLKEFCLMDAEKISYNMKIFYRAILKKGIEFWGEKFDVMLAAYILNPSSNDYGIQRIANENDVVEPEIIGENFDISDDDKELLKNLYFLNSVFSKLKEDIEKNNASELLNDIEEPLSEVLADMENTGFEIDEVGLKNYSEILDIEIKKIKKNIFDLAGFEFNINSPKQLGFILFENLKIPGGKKSKTGYLTNARILEELRDDYKIIDEILSYRALSKIKSTYCNGLIKLISKDGRIHSSFNQTETKTGRISSTEPNLQNIPVRTEIGRSFRKFFKAGKGNVLIDADYSQIELRLLAHLSQDECMVNAFKNDEDIHSLTASQVLNIPLSMVTPEMRFRAKAVNFGIIYGIGAFSLAKDLKISRIEAQKYIDRYFAHYEGISEYLKYIVDFAYKNGYVETMFNRRRYLPEINSSNYNLRMFGERVAKNMPIQGTAADIIKIAMVNIYKSLKNQKLKSKIILQVHDELIIESPMEEAEMATEILKFEMEKAIKLSVPLKVNIAVGETWFDAKS